MFGNIKLYITFESSLTKKPGVTGQRHKIMKTTLESTVPTHYQYQSISSFGLKVTSNGNGSYSVEEEFNTKKEAIDYMLNRAEYLAENDRELKEMRREIKQHGRLYYDAACLSIR